MDISFATDKGKFNYRVCAVIVNNGKLLCMHDYRSPYYYLPGGRVMMGETAEQAIIREIEEEFAISARISRPLWLNQAFFKEDVSGIDYHELCIYFLMDISDTNLLSKGEHFCGQEVDKQHYFEWIAFERLKEEYFSPLFMKKAIYHLPTQLTLITERE